jgi:CheY-like chemotaxis protein/anti-sigma regulatory factor (Ser/Thr protein kinase)
MLARRMLERLTDIEVHEAADGAEARQWLNENAASFVLTDLKMPALDGLGLVRLLRSEQPDLPVILMTAHGSEDTAAEALAAGAVSYIPKKRLSELLPRTIQSITASAEAARFEAASFGYLTEARLHFALDNDPDAVCLFRVYLQSRTEAIVGCDATDQMRVGMALEEALLNAVFHGNLEISSDLRQNGSNEFYELAAQRRTQPPYNERQVHVDVVFRPTRASFTIRDEGPGFDTSSLPDPADPSHLTDESGRGVRLIQTFMDEVRWNEAGNEIHMVKVGTPPAP